MSKLHYICVSLLIGASLLYLVTFLYHQNTMDWDLHYASSISAVTSPLIPDFSSSSGQHEAVSSYLFLTEKRGISVTVLLTVSICALVVKLMINEKRKFGPRVMQEPLIAGSVMLAITFVSTAVKNGMF
ncbi:MAG: hypothetical protein AAF431_07650 [Pseudomonadota bacterium]